MLFRDTNPVTTPIVGAQKKPIANHSTDSATGLSVQPNGSLRHRRLFKGSSLPVAHRPTRTLYWRASVAQRWSLLPRSMSAQKKAEKPHACSFSAFFARAFNLGNQNLFSRQLSVSCVDRNLRTDHQDSTQFSDVNRHNHMHVLSLSQEANPKTLHSS